MTTPLVSVILPTFNRARWLATSLESVRRQSYDRWELVVVDDGSTDDTPRYLATLTDPRIRVMRIERTDNPARVRNAGVAVARGTYLAFLDDDDLWMPDKLARQVAGLTGSGSRWGYTGFNRIDSAGRVLPDAALPPWRPFRGRILEPLLRIDAVVPLPTVMVEAGLFAEVGGFDDAFPDCEDYELWFRLAARAEAQVEEAPLVSVRVHPNHRQANRERVHASWIAVYDKTAKWVSDAESIALCALRKSEHQVLLARLLAGRGDRAGALKLLGRAGRQARSNSIWWKTLARSLLPAPVVSALRALLRPGGARVANRGVRRA